MNIMCQIAGTSKVSDLTTKALQAGSDAEHAVARELKMWLDQRYSETWHCIVIVGPRFASYVSHQKRHFMYMEFFGTSVVVFRC